MVDQDNVGSFLPRTVLDDVDVDALHEIADTFYDDTCMQTLRSTLSKPCPFCGFDEPYIQTSQLGEYGWEARHVCSRCHVATTRECYPSRLTYLPTGEDLSRTIAVGMSIARWNRRA